MHKLVALCTDAKMETNACTEGLQHGSSTFLTIAVLLHLIMVMQYWGM